VIGVYALVAEAPAGLLGAKGEPLRAVACAGFVALAGESPPPLSVEALRAHEAAVRRIADASAACLPVRFGASVLDDDALRAQLEPRAAELSDALQLVRGREQMTLRVNGPGAPAPLTTAAGAGTRYLEERRRARKVPELDPLRLALQAFIRAERLERHSEPGLLASVYHLIDRGASAEYQRIAERVALEGLRLLVSGPWPAWSFAPEVAPP
jgi:hypothetical protein